MLLLMIPFWTSSLIRLYGWIIIFRAGGVLDSVLMALHITSEPLKVLYTYPAVVVGMVYALLPFMIFAVYSSAEKLDFSLVEAARDLGASPMKAFLTVSLKLTLPGLLSGVVLTFVPQHGAVLHRGFAGRQQGGAGGQPHPDPADERPQLAFRGGAFGGAAGAHHGDYLAVQKALRREGLRGHCIVPRKVACPPQALRYAKTLSIGLSRARRAYARINPSGSERSKARRKVLCPASAKESWQGVGLRPTVLAGVRGLAPP